MSALCSYPFLFFDLLNPITQLGLWQHTETEDTLHSLACVYDHGFEKYALRKEKKKPPTSSNESSAAPTSGMLD